VALIRRRVCALLLVRFASFANAVIFLPDANDNCLTCGKAFGGCGDYLNTANAFEATNSSQSMSAMISGSFIFMSKTY
jgi:hypothetical protein